MYYRLYPKKNNTIFKYNYLPDSLNANTGKNPIFELMDGYGESKILMNFEMPEWLWTKIQNNEFTSKLQLFDAGVLYEPATKLKEISLLTFNEEFIEGDGYSFTPNDFKLTNSNWNKRDSINDWGINFNHILDYHLESSNDDLNFQISWDTSKTSMNFMLKFKIHENSETLYRKFIYSKYTKTVFKPYIEFFVRDEVKDNSMNFVANEQNRIYLINQNKKDFNGTLQCFFITDAGNEIELSVYNKKNGIYYANAKTDPMINKGLMSIVWKLNGNFLKSQKINVLPSENIYQRDLKNLFFYPTTNSTNNVLTHGDIVPFSIISEIRGQGTILLDSYQYRVLSEDGFELCPWTDASNYLGSIFFFIFTDYYFPETNYEIFVRVKDGDSIITSPLSYRFKLRMNEKSFMRDIKTNPYYSREQNFIK